MLAKVFIPQGKTKKKRKAKRLNKKASVVLWGQNCARFGRNPFQLFLLKPPPTYWSTMVVVLCSGDAFHSKRLGIRSGLRVKKGEGPNIRLWVTLDRRNLRIALHLLFPSKKPGTTVFVNTFVSIFCVLADIINILHWYTVQIQVK